VTPRLEFEQLFSHWKTPFVSRFNPIGGQLVTRRGKGFAVRLDNAVRLVAIGFSPLPHRFSERFEPFGSGWNN
jgi:hypothetical protein